MSRAKWPPRAVRSGDDGDDSNDGDDGNDGDGSDDGYHSDRSDDGEHNADPADDFDLSGTSLNFTSDGEGGYIVTSGCDDGGNPNSAPKASFDSATTTGCEPVTFSLVDNDTDIDGNLDPNSVTITQDPSKGSVVNNGDGTVTYTPDDGPNSTDTFNYTVADTGGLVSNNATVQVTITN